MIHYHGGPISPDSCAIRAWERGHALISYVSPQQTGLAAHYCQSFALDNGAFSLWKQGKVGSWEGYYDYVRKWYRHPGFDFAIVPDVIDGGEQANDALLDEWPFAKHVGAPVWHFTESIERLERLAEAWPRVCLGSLAEYDVQKHPVAFMERATEAIRAISDSDGYPACRLHGLRMLSTAVFSVLPLASADSTNISRSIAIDALWSKGTYLPRSKETRTLIMRERIEAFNSPARLAPAGTVPRPWGGVV